MATLPPTLDEFSAWVGQSFEADDPRAGAVLSAAASLARGYAGKTWDDDEVPDEVHAVVLQIAGRVWHNPQGLIAETVDDYSRRFAEGDGGLFLTDFEQTVLGRYRTSTSGLWSQPISTGALETPLDDMFVSDLDHGDASGTYLPTR